MIERLRQEALRFSRYGALGAITTVVLYVAYLGLLWGGVSPVSAAGICYVPGIAVSYFGNRRWTFESNESHRSDLPKFAFAYAAGFVSTLATVSIMLRWLPPALAQVANFGVTPIVIYISLRLVGFGGKEQIGAS